jgi:hypothetical protein
VDRLGYYHNWPFSADILAPLDFELNDNRFDGYISKNNRRLPGGKWSGGSDFLSKKKFIRYTPSSDVQVRLYDLPMYTGRYVAAAPSFPENNLPYPDFGLISPDLYRAGSPDKPIMDLGNSLYELRELPKMVKQAYESVREIPNFSPVRLSEVSNFNLAVFFGWLPLLRDTQELYNSQRTLQARLKQLIRDNGRPVRREFRSDKHSFDHKTILSQGTSDHYPDGMTPNHVTQVYGGGNWELSHHEMRKVWFSAKFRYWLPPRTAELSEFQWQAALVRRLFGSKPTPARIYKAIPWSWLIDWFANVGDNLANLDASVADRLINDYAYVMCHQEAFTRYTATQRVKTGEDTFTSTTSVTDAGYSRKERDRAVPFGFGLKRSDLSPFQLTILGSLGGSRM